MRDRRGMYWSGGGGESEVCNVKPGGAGMSGKSKMRVSQAQLARELGVSQRTVSYALNGSGRIRDSLRQRILDAAEDFGYRPNRLAAGLRGSKTRSVGIVWSFVNPWTEDSGIALEVVKRFQLEGFAVYQALHDDDVRILCSRIDDLLDRCVDALVVQATPSQLCSPDVRRRLSAVSSVTVCREYIQNLKADQVIHARDPAIFEVVDYLWASGRRRPCMVLSMGEESNPPKYRAFVKRWEDHGVAETKEMLVDMTAAEARDSTCSVDSGPSYEEHGVNHRIAFASKFPDRTPVDCVFCFNDMGALYMMRELEDRGLRIPEDVAVVGFNNNQAGAAWRPALASGDRRQAEVSGAVIRFLERRLEDPASPFARADIPMRFIWRESAGPFLPEMLTESGNIREKQDSGSN